VRVADDLRHEGVHRDAGGRRDEGLACAQLEQDTPGSPDVDLALVTGVGALRRGVGRRELHNSTGDDRCSFVADHSFMSKQVKCSTQTDVPDMLRVRSNSVLISACDICMLIILPLLSELYGSSRGYACFN